MNTSTSEKAQASVSLQAAASSSAADLREIHLEQAVQYLARYQSARAGEEMAAAADALADALVPLAGEPSILPALLRFAYVSGRRDALRTLRGLPPRTPLFELAAAIARPGTQSGGGA